MRLQTCTRSHLQSLHNRIPSTHRQVHDLHHGVKAASSRPYRPTCFSGKPADPAAVNLSLGQPLPSPFPLRVHVFTSSDTSVSVLKVDPTCALLTLLCGEETCVLLTCCLVHPSLSTDGDVLLTCVCVWRGGVQTERENGVGRNNHKVWACVITSERQHYNPMIDLYYLSPLVRVCARWMEP